MTNPKMSEVSFQNLPTLKMACYRVISREPEDEGGRFMNAWVEAQGLEGVRRFGFDVPVTAEQSGAGMRGYEQWYSVPDTVTSSDEVTVRSFPGGRYAVLRLFDPFSAPFETIPTGWHYLHEWVQSHPEIKCGHHQCLEELVAGEAGGMDLILYYPIE